MLCARFRDSPELRRGSSSEGEERVLRAAQAMVEEPSGGQSHRAGCHRTPHRKGGPPIKLGVETVDLVNPKMTARYRDYWETNSNLMAAPWRVSRHRRAINAHQQPLFAIGAVMVHREEADS